MRCSESWFKVFLCGIFLLLAAHYAAAAEIVVRSPALTAADDGYNLSADFGIDFNRRLEEVVNKGVVLYFAVDFELNQPRWYWLDRKVVQRSRVYQLSYHALTRQYRLSTGGLHQSFDSLAEALRVLSRIRGWQVLEKGSVNDGQVYVAGVRKHLDLSQMAKTFQVGALSSRDWNLSSEWTYWQFEPKDEDFPDAQANPTAGNEGENR